VAREREDLQHLQDVLDWRFDAKASGRAEMPGKFIEALKESTAYQLITFWIQVRCVDILLEGIGAEFNDMDPLLPKYREALEETREKLLACKEHLLVLNTEVVLREPLAEELDELRSFANE
jgi:hypothetical protein